MKPKLNGGEGFGDHIAVVQLRGTGVTWVFVVVEILETHKAFDIKFRVHTGVVLTMEGDARYKHMHVVAAPFPAGVHWPDCLGCKVKATLRNGFGKMEC